MDTKRKIPFAKDLCSSRNKCSKWTSLPIGEVIISVLLFLFFVVLLGV
jgi:hypothetical protein